jgi:hypothetical protein
VADTMSGAVATHGIEAFHSISPTNVPYRQFPGRSLGLGVTDSISHDMLWVARLLPIQNLLCFRG